MSAPQKSQRPADDGAKGKRTAKSKSNHTAPWRKGLPFYAAHYVDRWREFFPRDPLPPAIQVALARFWRRAA